MWNDEIPKSKIVVLLHAIARINTNIDFTGEYSASIKHFKKHLQIDPFMDSRISKMSVLPLNTSHSMSINSMLASANEHIVLIRQQQYFRDGKANLPRNDDDRVQVSLVRFKAQRYKIENLVDHGDGDSIFSQLYRGMKAAGNNWEHKFRRDYVEARVFKANFLHEGSIDDGGPYREAMEDLSREMTMGIVPILRKSANQINNSGQMQECFVFNHLAKSDQELEMFRFFGVLMGFAVRCSQTFNIDLHPMIWKQVVGQPLDYEHDLNTSDRHEYL